MLVIGFSFLVISISVHHNILNTGFHFILPPVNVIFSQVPDPSLIVMKTDKLFFYKIRFIDKFSNICINNFYLTLHSLTLSNYAFIYKA